MQMNGIAHIAVNVSNFEKCSGFYRQLFEFLEMQLIYDTDTVIYGVGSRTGILVRGAPEEYRNDRYSQDRAGLHHYCFRARSQEDVDLLHEFLVDLGANIVRAPQLGEWAPGYYSVLFEDPEGIRIEANYVPGKGNLDPSVDLPKKSTDYT
jgi:catechol 2,3-dioxygenase-like lactoylglutathione lyase family enzyme